MVTGGFQSAGHVHRAGKMEPTRLSELGSLLWGTLGGDAALVVERIAMSLRLVLGDRTRVVTDERADSIKPIVHQPASRSRVSW